ncbi:hypothetical protein ACQZV8_10600 [Magnetococcales bacterium HHB-1]
MIAHPPFKKILPGASLQFQPDHLNRYDHTPWDLRLSLPHQPLEEAFFITFSEDALLHIPIEELLEKEVFLEKQRDHLDILTYPELPFLFDELKNYWQAVKRGDLQLEIYVNNAPSHRPLSLKTQAKKWLSVCTFHNGAYDYRVLDLIWQQTPTPLPLRQLNLLRDRYATITILIALDWWQQEIAWSTPIGIPVSWTKKEAPHTAQLLDDMRCEGVIHCVDQQWQLTSLGKKRLHDLKQEANDLIDRFDCFKSVSLYPPALAVPEGFDVRLQMIALAGGSPERALFLITLFSDGDLLWSDDQWLLRLESGRFLQDIYQALRYRSGFTKAVLEPLWRLAPQTSRFLKDTR